MPQPALTVYLIIAAIAIVVVLIAVIVIDNYDELIRGLTDRKRSELRDAIEDKLLQWCEGKGGFFQNFFVIVCDRPDEMYFYIFVVILHDITGEEVFESVQNDSVDTRLFDIFDEERRYRCQKTIGERLLVYVIQNFFWRESEAVEKFFF